MNVMLITALITAVFSTIASRQYELATSLQTTSKDKKNFTTYRIFVFLSIATLACVAGLRYYVGTDYGGYYNGYPRWEQEFVTRWQKWDEPGLSTIAKLLYFFTQDGAAFIFVLAALTMFLCGITIAKYSDTFAFSIMLYIFTSCWSGAFNGVRQYLAAAVFFAGHRLILERKFIKYCILVFIASSFHITALVMLPMYFLITQVLDLKKIVFIIVSGITLVFSYDFLFDLAGILKDSEKTATDSVYAQNQIHPLRIVIALAPIVLYFILLAQKKGFTGAENFYMGFIFVRAAFIFATANSAYLNRIDIYFLPFVAIGLSKLILKFPKNQQFILKAIVLILYCIVWLYIDASTITWTWIFDRVT